MSDEAFANEDPYGPGSDLMLSLFAISMLLLSIVGVGQPLEEVEQAAKVLGSAPAAIASPSRLPPLKLVAPKELAAEARRRAEAETKAAELALAEARGRAEIGTLTERLARMDEALAESRDKLQALRDQKPDGRMELLVQRIPVSGLAPFLGDPSEIALSLTDADRAAIAKAARPFPPGADQIFIETSVPPELFALLPKAPNAGRTMNRITLLSAALGQAYQFAFAKAGVPLACISLIVRSFDGSPDVRRQALVEATDAPAAFEELAVFYEGMDPAEAGRAFAEARVLLGTGEERPCDPDALKTRLSDLRP